MLQIYKRALPPGICLHKFWLGRKKLRNIDGPRTVPEHFEVNFMKGSFRMSTKLEKKFKERANTLDLTRTTDSSMFDGETNYTLLILRAC